MCQSLQAADVKSPEELTASIGVGATRGAMMGDQSLGKARSKFIGVVRSIYAGKA
jgi:hypothetical protein